MAEVTKNHAPESAPPGDEAPEGKAAEEEASPPRQEEPASEPAEDPGYLMETGEAAGENGSVVPIIGGLPAVQGSAWDIGAAADERGAALAVHEARQQADEANHEDQVSDEEKR